VGSYPTSDIFIFASLRRRLKPKNPNKISHFLILLTSAQNRVTHERSTLTHSN
jgi:hypothetical protein